MNLLTRKYLFIATVCNPIRAMSLGIISNEFRILQLARGDLAAIEIFGPVIPAFRSESRKGDSGRIGVVGGSPDYTGAPYYAAASALKTGADLCFVFCAKEACIPIKSYSPELMVTPFYEESDTHTDSDATSTAYSEYDSPEWHTLSSETGTDTGEGAGTEHCPTPSSSSSLTPFLSLSQGHHVQQAAARLASKVTDCFPRLDCLVIGPGLGRDRVVLSAVALILAAARQSDKPVVLDADALWMVAHNFESVFGNKKCVLTPNAPEFLRLVEAAKKHYDKILQEKRGKKEIEENNTISKILRNSREYSLSDVEKILQGLSSSVEEEKLRFLSLAFGSITIVKKGASDMVCGGSGVFRVSSPGSLKRCGGQGDILAGCIGVASCWTAKYGQNLPTAEEIHQRLKWDEYVTTGEEMAREQGVGGGGEGEGGVGAVSSGGGGTGAEACVGLEGRIGEGEHPSVWGVLFACSLVRRAGYKAFSVCGRSMGSPDVLTQLHSAFEEMHIEG